MVRILLQGHTHKDENIRAMSVKLLWERNLHSEYIHDNPEEKPRLFRYWLQALQDRSPLVQRAALTSLKLMNETYNYSMDPVIVVLHRLLKSNPSPFMRYQLLYALGCLKDRQVLDEIAFNFKSPLLERINIMLGFGWGNLAMKPQHAQHAINGLMRILNQDPDPLMRSFILFTTTRNFRSFSRHNSNIQFGLLHGLLKACILRNLNSPSALIRIYAVLTATHLDDVPSQILHQLYRVWQRDPQLHIRAIALGCLIYLKACRSENVSSLHRWLKQSQRENIYILAACWGYYRIIEHDMRISSTLAEQMQWDILQIRHYQGSSLYKYAQDPKKRRLYGVCLQKAIAIINCLPKKTRREQEIYQDYCYLLALLYSIDGRPEQALQFLAQLAKNLSRQGPHLSVLWVRLLVESGQIQPALAKLHQLDTGSTTLPSSRLVRIQADIQLNRKNYRQAELLYYRQYYLFPRDPSALAAIGNYYCARKQYTRAYLAFQEAALQFSGSGEARLGLARVYAVQGDISYAMLCLRAACSLNYLRTIEQLAQYPELTFIRQHQHLLRELSRYLNKS